MATEITGGGQPESVLVGGSALDFLRTAPSVVEEPAEAPVVDTEAPPAQEASKALQFLQERTKALQRSTAAAPGPIGLAESRGITEATRNIETLEGLRQEGVDIMSGGAGFGARAEMAFTRDERLNTFLERNFDDFYTTEAGLVVTVRDESGRARKVLLDEAGLSLADLGDAAPELLEVAAAVIGTTAVAATGTVSVPVLAAAAALSEFTAGSAGETLAMMHNGGFDGEMFQDIIAEQGVDAGINFALDMLLAGGGRLVRLATSPLGGKMALDPAASIKAAADRLNVVLTPGTITQSEAVIRAEAVAEKVPGSAGVARKAKDKEESGLQDVIDKQIEARRTAGEVGEDISDVLTRQRDTELAVAERQRQNAENITNQRTEDLEKTMATRVLSTNEAGELSRRAIEREQIKFRAAQKVKATRSQALINQLPPNKRTFASAVELKTTAQNLEDQFPKQTVEEVVDSISGQTSEIGRETIGELFPSSSRRVLRGIGKLDDNVTVQELRNVRQGVSAMVDNAPAFPGVNIGMLKKLEADLTKAIRGAANNAPNAEIRASILDELDHFAKGVGKFQTRPIAAALKSDTQAGYKEGVDVLPNLILRDRPEDALRVLGVIGEDSIAAKASRRAAFNSIIRDAHDPVLGEGVADPKTVLRALGRMSPKTKEILFRGRQGEVEELFRISAARHGQIDLTRLKSSPGNQDLLGMLQDSMAQEVATRRVFDRKVFKRILSDEIDVTSMRPDQFVRFTLRDANPGEITELFRRLDGSGVPGLSDEFRTHTVAHILSKADTRAGDVTQAITRVGGKTTPGDSLADVLTEFGESAKDSGIKLKAILGEDGFNVLQDMAIVQAARSQKRSAAAAAGGLVGGTIVSNVMRLRPGVALDIARYRVIGGLLNHSLTRAWLTGKGIPGLSREKVKGKITKSDALRIGGVVLPQFSDTMATLYGEMSPESELAQTLENNLPEFLK